MIRLKTLAAAALAVSLLPSGGAMAQVPGGSIGGRGGGGFAQSGAQEVISIDFGGGNLAEYYEHLQQHTGVRNIILKGAEFTEVTMPEVRLSTVLFADAVELPYFLASVPEGHALNINTVGSRRSIFVVWLDESANTTVVDPVRRPISFEFEGGSLQDFVATVQKAAGTQRILVRGDAAGFEMPLLQLENVTLRGVVSALDGDERRSASGERSRVRVHDRDGVYVVEVETAQISRGITDAPSIHTQSWTVVGLLGPGRLSIDDVLAALEAAIEVSGTTELTDMRFHEPSSLLVAAAPQSTLILIDGTLDRLRETSDRLHAEYQRIQRLKADLAGAENQIDQLKTSIAEAEKVVSEGVGGDPQQQRMIAIYESELVRMRSSLRETMAKADAVRYSLSNKD